jgi:glucuronate isomerase
MHCHKGQLNLPGIDSHCHIDGRYLKSHLARCNSWLVWLQGLCHYLYSMNQLGSSGDDLTSQRCMSLQMDILQKWMNQLDNKSRWGTLS